MIIDRELLQLPQANSSLAEFSYVRDLTEDDKLILESNQAASYPAFSISKIRDRHHWIAQLVSAGTPNVEISRMTGMTASRISQLKSDPAFKELLAHYRGVTKEHFVDVTQRLSVISGMITEEIAERLEENAESISNKDLISLAEVIMDRSGNGKSSTLKVVNFDAAEVIRELKRKSQAEIESTVIPREEELTVVENIKIS